jgi:poly(hydroxyalkanoate) depolymerase family esterase
MKASLLARRRPLSAAALLQRMVMFPEPSLKHTKRPAKSVKPVKRRTPLKTPRASRPAPGSFVSGRLGNAHGDLAYKLYTPRGSTRRRLPLVVMLHGCTQSATDFALGTGMNRLADERGFLVLYPQQSVSANLGRCWNWHRPGDQKRGSGEPAAIAALTRHAMTICRANPSRVYIAGISAGGAAAAIIASAYPELYVAVGVHSGLARGNVSTLSGALAAMRSGVAAGAAAGGKVPGPLPTIVFHGDQDNVVHPSNASGFLAQLQRSGAGSIASRTQRGRSSGGRDFTRTVYRRSGGEVLLEDWTVHGSGHAWSGGSAAGSYTDPAGPDASREMIRFFLTHKRPAAVRREGLDAGTNRQAKG